MLFTDRRVFAGLRIFRPNFISAGWAQLGGRSRVRFLSIATISCETMQALLRGPVFDSRLVLLPFAATSDQKIMSKNY